MGLKLLQSAWTVLDQLKLVAALLYVVYFDYVLQSLDWCQNPDGNDQVAFFPLDVPLGCKQRCDFEAPSVVHGIRARGTV